MTRYESMGFHYILKFQKVTYMLMRPDIPGPGYIHLKDEIPFGTGKRRMCGYSVVALLQYAICCGSRITHEWCSGWIEQLKDDADDSDFSYIYPASMDFTNILTAN
jgi:hypothetical protein